MRKIGRFLIHSKLIDLEYEKIAKIFSMLKIVPVRVELFYYSNSFEYCAISERFDEIPDSEMVPLYNIKCEVDSNGWPETVIVEKCGYEYHDFNIDYRPLREL